MPKPRLRLARMGIFFLAVAAFLTNQPAAVAEVIRIGGTGSALGTISLLTTAFEKRHPGIKITILPSIGSSGAIKAVSLGALDIGLVSRELKPAELELGLLIASYARTPFVFVAGKNVPVSGLRHEELVKIFKGEIWKWPDGGRVRLVLRPAADADTIIVRDISSEMSVAMAGALSREGMLMALTNQEALDLMEKTPGSVGFSSLSQIKSENRSLKMLSYNGVSPSAKSLENGTYPLSLKLSLITKPERSPSVRRFIDFVRSPEGRIILTKTGNVPI